MIRELNFVISERRKLFRAQKPTQEQKICRHTLDHYVTYRLPESSNADFFVAGRVYLRLIRSLLSPFTGRIEVNKTSNSAVLGSAESKKDAILDNLKFQGENSPRFFFVRENLRPNLNLFQKLLVLFRITLYAKWIFLKTLNGKYRQRKALSILQAFETASLLHLVGEYNINKVYDFSGFLIDSNFISKLLINRNVEVIKSPSPGPLKTHYQHLLTSTICYSSPYHKKELETYGESMIFLKTVKWKPQMSHFYLPYYQQKKYVANSDKTIAFYSHGEWLRREMDHSDVGTGTLESEEFILDCLQQTLKKNPDYSLNIYPHPLEKRKENIEKTTKYYNRKLENIEFTLAGEDVKTSLSFHKENIALVAASTMIYERLLCGYKILIGGKSSKFLPSVGLNNIEFLSYSELEDQLEKNISLTTQKYFDTNDLMGFHYSTYPD